MSDTVIVEEKKQRDLNNISSDELFTEWFTRYCEEKANPEAPLTLPGGLEFYRDDALIVVGGMPGVGKSAWVSSNGAVELAKQGAHVVVCSYEMRHSSSMERILSCHSNSPGDEGICLNDIRARRVDEAVLPKIYNDQIFSLPGKIHFCRPKSEKELSKFLDEKVVPLMPAKARLVIIYDYLQRMPWTDSDDPRISAKNNLRALQELGNRYLATSIVLASLNRSGYGKLDLSVFKEAGEIESDADMAILLNPAEEDRTREGEYKICGTPEDAVKARRQAIMPVLINLIKCRSGAEREIAMMFNKPFQRFNLAYNDAPSFVRSGTHNPNGVPWP